MKISKYIIGLTIFAFALTGCSNNEDAISINENTKQDILMFSSNVEFFDAITKVNKMNSEVLERAKAGLGKGDLQPATPADYMKQLQKGQLEEADRSMTTLLNANPDDKILREQAGRLYGILIQAFAAKEQWSEAEEYLHRGRAMFPGDKSWSARLHLLESIQSMAKKDRQPWIQLLG